MAPSRNVFAWARGSEMRSNEPGTMPKWTRLSCLLLRSCVPCGTNGSTRRHARTLQEGVGPSLTVLRFKLAVGSSRHQPEGSQLCYQLS